MGLQLKHQLEQQQPQQHPLKQQQQQQQRDRLQLRGHQHLQVPAKLQPTSHGSFHPGFLLPPSYPPSLLFLLPTLSHPFPPPRLLPLSPSTSAAVPNRGRPAVGASAFSLDVKCLITPRNL